MSNKRTRNQEDHISECVQELATTLERNSDVKIQALDRILALIDHSDENYTNQKALIDADAAFYICELLQDSNSFVACRSAEAIKACCEHSAECIAKLNAGPLLGLENNIHKALFNPIQGSFVDNNAVLPLCDWLLGRNEHKRNIAAQTLTTLYSYHLPGKISFLECLVEAFKRGQLQAMEHIETMIETLDIINDNISTILDQISAPLIAVVKSPPPHFLVSALILLGTLCLAQPLQTDVYTNSGVVKVLAQNILYGSAIVKDAGARALWVLASNTRQHQNVLLQGVDKGGEFLECPADALAQQLNRLISLAKIAEEEAEEKADAAASGGKGGSDAEDDEYGDQSWSSPGLAPMQQPASEEICYAEEAELLLNEMARQNPGLDNDIDDGAVRRTSCRIM